MNHIISPYIYNTYLEKGQAISYKRLCYTEGDCIGEGSLAMLLPQVHLITSPVALYNDSNTKRHCI